MASSKHATLAILNANVITMNPKQPKAQAVAIKNGKILTVGTNAKVKQYMTEKTRTIDAKGKTVLPGLIDTHVHMTSLGSSLKELNLRGTASIDELQQKLEKYSRTLPPGKWVIGRGWDQEKFREKRYPTRRDLDKAEPHRPVLIVRVCGHLAVANTQALRLMKMTKKAAFSCEEIGRDKETGELTGILQEKAVDQAWKAVPKPTTKELEETCVSACREAAKNGLTTVHWITSSPKELEILQKLRREGRLLIRVYVIVPVEHLEHFAGKGLRTGHGDEWLRIGGCKIFTDGSLGARTALLTKPYADQPETCGIAVYTQEELNDVVAKAHNAGFQLAVHAIGDKAVDMTLTAFEKLAKKEQSQHRRHRIEHASVLNRQLIKRMDKLRVTVSVQPHFIVSDFWVAQRLGLKRARWTYPLKTIVANNIIATAGSDSPVEPLNPILGVWAAVARETFKKERLSLEEALRLYTVNAAYSSFEEDEKGSIKPGKLADLVVLSEDLEKTPKEKIKEVKVETTIVNGAIVH